MLLERDVYRCDSTRFKRCSARNLPLLFSRGVEKLFYFLASLQVLMGAYLIWHALQWARICAAQIELRPWLLCAESSRSVPRCKGVESGLERNLVSLTEFERQTMRFFQSSLLGSDPARSIIERVAKNSRVKAHVLDCRAAQQLQRESEQLRVAIEQLPPEFEVLAFADSDGRPGKSWLHHLIAPLGDVRIGAATTMRWFMSESQ